MRKRTVLEFLFPSIVAYNTNKRLKKESAEINFNKLSSKWERVLAQRKAECLERVVDNLYDAEMRRKEIIESKALSLFEGIAFTVSLLSVALVFIGQRLISVILLLPMFHFIMSALCSWNVSRVAEHYFFTTLNGFEQDLKATSNLVETECKRYWMTQKLACTGINNGILITKSNWLSAAYQHFVLGILFVIPILVAMTYEILRTHIVLVS